MRNCDRHHSREDILEMALKFMKKLCNIGYQAGTRLEVMKSAITKHYRDLADEKTGGPPLEVIGEMGH